MVTKLVDDLIHLKCGGDCLNEHSTTDGTSWHADIVLSQVEDIVPETRLEVRLHLGEIEVWASTSLDELFGVVEEVETEVEETAGDGLAVYGEMLLLQVPATCARNQGGQSPVSAELVPLLALLEIDLSSDGIVEVDLTVDHILPCWRA